MSVRVLRLGTERVVDEGLRIGTVRHPPRGVPKSEFASHNWYDVWFPQLSPSPEAIKLAHAAQTEADWANFFKHYRAEMKAPEAQHALELLAALSKQTNFSVGCYCENEAHCHRHALRELLAEQGAQMA